MISAYLIFILVCTACDPIFPAAERITTSTSIENVELIDFSGLLSSLEKLITDLAEKRAMETVAMNSSMTNNADPAVGDLLFF